MLDRYAEDDINEIEHVFISDLKWLDSYGLNVQDKMFWEKLENSYDIIFTDEEKKEIVTIGDLRMKISYKGIFIHEAKDMGSV